MIIDLRSFEWRAAASLVPGLVHFGSNPPVFTPRGLVKRIRLSIPGKGQLRIARLTVKPRAPDTLDGATVRQSSFAGPSHDARRAFEQKSIHTTIEAEPFWEASFRAPIGIEQFEILNQTGRQLDASYPLLVEVEDEAGRVWRWDNAGEIEMRQRLRAFETNVSGMVAAFRAMIVPGAAIARAKASLTRLAVAAEAALSDGLAPVDGRLRQRALRASVALVDAATGDRRAALLAAAPILTLLIERRAAAQSRAFSQAEIEAVAMTATAGLVRRSKLSRYRTAEDGIFLRAPVVLKQLETRINALWLESGGDPRMCPFLYRKHGLSASHLILESERHLDGIEEVMAAFSTRGYDCALAYGTLLGAVREKTFIPHDDDIDLIFRVPGTVEAGTVAIRSLLRDLRGAGFQPRLVEPKLIVKVRGPVTGIGIDVFPMFDDGGPEVTMAMEKIALRPIAREELLPFAPVEFYGRQFMAPAQPEVWLCNRYGATWRTPIREFAGGSAVMEP